MICPTPTPGKVQRVYVACCAHCGQSKTAGRYYNNTKAEAESDFRWAGWTKTVARGWVCPSCKPKP